MCVPPCVVVVDQPCKLIIAYLQQYAIGEMNKHTDISMCKWHTCSSMIWVYNRKREMGVIILGKTSSAVKNRYNAKAYDQLPVRVPKGRKQDIEAFAQSRGESVNGLVNKLLRDAMQKSEEDWKAIAEE